MWPYFFPVLEIILELKQISYEDLKAYKMSPGDIYWKNSSGNTVLLRHRGDWLDYSYLEKFEKRSIALFVARAIDTEFINQFQMLTKNYLQAKTLEEKEIHWQEWLSAVRSRYWNGENVDGAFELKLFFENLFYELTDSETEHYLNHDLELFDRYLIVAADVVFLLLILGFNDFQFLKSMYNTALRGLDLIKNEKLTVSLKEEIADYFSGKTHELKAISVENFINEQKDERQKYWTSILFEDLKAEAGILKVFDNEIGDAERVLIFSHRTRAFIGKGKDLFVFEYLKNNELKYMSPHLMKKLAFYLKEGTKLTA